MAPSSAPTHLPLPHRTPAGVSHLKLPPQPRALRRTRSRFDYVVQSCRDYGSDAERANAASGAGVALSQSLATDMNRT